MRSTSLFPFLFLILVHLCKFFKRAVPLPVADCKTFRPQCSPHLLRLLGQMCRLGR